ncbi:hypothetical protein ACI2KS_19170, partial [Pseudomonas sp. NPDC087358]|uniref:hypothetical protein n=1 Tax=Pseudomonas sp. NPDC087358 TaxID=3364439 RepID=UPI00384AA475
MALHLADDLPGTGSESRRLGCIRHTAVAGLAGASHQIASKLAPTAFGQNQEQVRIRHKAACGQNHVQVRIRHKAAFSQNQRRVLLLPEGRGSLPGWRSTLPTICRAPAVNPDAWVVSDTPQLQDLLALRTRSRAS